MLCRAPNFFVAVVCSLLPFSPSWAEQNDTELLALIAGMSTEQKVAQMIQAEIKYITPEQVVEFGIGSILNGGGSFPQSNKYATVQDWVELADAFHAASLDRSQGSAGIPIIWGTDAVHGHNNVIGATIFPHNIGLGAANNPQLVADIAAATAREVAATGIDWIFAPTVAIAKDDRWGRTYEAYSDRSDIVGRYAGQVVRAMQQQNIAATAKHFIGDGGTFRGIDQGDTRLSLEQLLLEHGIGYSEAIAADVLTVMASFNSWNGEKLHGSYDLITTILKEGLGFDGFVVSDWNGIGQIPGCSNESCAQAINAGIDMIMVPEDWQPFLTKTLAQIERGEIAMSRIDDAVYRILSVKKQLGLLDGAAPSSRHSAVGSGVIGSAKHRAIARQAVRESLVLLKNSRGLVPLSPDQNILVAGLADDIGVASGGWTISWQGTGNTNADFPGGTSIYTGLAQQVAAAGGSINYSANGDYQNKPDVAIVVFGEQPYAEGQGDIDNLQFDAAAKQGLQTVRKLKAEGIPVVAVFLTGRPLWVNAEINAADAFVAAWLPGTEGEGVADVLLRDAKDQVQYNFRGRLSFDWPNSDVNSENRDLPVDDILFPYGYGLSAGEASDKRLDNLNEEPTVAAAASEVVVFQRGTKAPWRPYVGDASNWRKLYSGGVVATQYGEMTVSSVDIMVQEDGRKLSWQGNGKRESQFYWQADQGMDLTALAEDNAALVVSYQLLREPSSAVTLRMDCSYPCSGALDITAELQMSQEWQNLALPLSCFAQRGVDLSKVNTPMLLSTAGQLELLVRNVAITAQLDGLTVQACQ
ncbi:exo 1,3/1,4-beta-D-glucan glucohydrolase [Porticoccaceae bacterium]|nr:exo 1,3/1,4-beta-D-glucan glucohydrolase [Porticoccaceae bacterium]